jgi:hypothetical protein
MEFLPQQPVALVDFLHKGATEMPCTKNPDYPARLRLKQRGFSRRNLQGTNIHFMNIYTILGRSATNSSCLESTKKTLIDLFGN